MELLFRKTESLTVPGRRGRALLLDKDPIFLPAVGWYSLTVKIGALPLAPPSPAGLFIRVLAVLAALGLYDLLTAKCQGPTRRDAVVSGHILTQRGCAPASRQNAP
jgi:hypothetical protein